MEKESKLFTVAKWVLGLGIAYASSFFILGVVKGLVGLIACAVIGTVAIQAWPLFQFVLSNAIIAGYKIVAREAPITSMQNVVMGRERELELARNETTEVDTQTRAFEREVVTAESQYPDAEELVTLREQLQMLKDDVASRREDEAQLEQDIAKAKSVIKRMEVMWKASQVGQRAAKRAKMSRKEFDKLVMQTAANTVMESMDRSAAQLAARRAKSEAQRAALPPARVTANIPAARVTVPLRRQT